MFLVLLDQSQIQDCKDLDGTFCRILNFKYLRSNLAGYFEYLKFPLFWVSVMSRRTQVQDSYIQDGINYGFLL
jgi:hypothetical protein